MDTIYNHIGENYSMHRKPDRRIVDAILNLLDLPQKAAIADIGAGSGNYSNALADNGYCVCAIEPSFKMIRQKKYHCNVNWVQAAAEHIPIKSRSFDGIFVIMALHHFNSKHDAFMEFDRICKNGTIVLLTFDPRQSNKFWFADYFPSIWNQAFSAFPAIEEIAQTFAGTYWDYDIFPFPLPHDLSDKFLASAWRQPEIYLDQSIRNGMSAFALADQKDVEQGIHLLKMDIESGAWESKYGWVRGADHLDLGYRFIRLKRK